MSSDPMLPKFSDRKDIEEFVQTVEAFERGEIDAEKFRMFRLLRGVYGQRQAGAQMLRIKIPMGLLGPRQLLAVADVADRHSRGFGHVTTRQNIQMHFMKMAEMAGLMLDLDAVGLTTREACGNSVRNVTACELAEVCTGAAFDVTPYAEALVRHFLRHPLSSSLPRKFKMAFSGCETDCAYGAISDLGFVAQVRDGQRGFKVYAAGGLSTTPQAALVLHDFVPAAELGRVGEAVVRLFHALGNRDNKHRARMKYVLRRLGEAGFREAYARQREAVDAEAMAELVLPSSPDNLPAAPVPSPAGPLPAGYLQWRGRSVVDQRQDGFAAVYVRLFLGDLTSAQMRGLADILPRFGDGTLRLTIDQNLLVPWVARASLPALYLELRALGLARDDVHTARDVTSCPGAETCNLAVTSSRSVARAIAERLEGADVAASGALGATTIKISGCPNSCGQHHVADIGWHGAVKSVDGTAVPMYQLHLGGGVDRDGARFGRQVVKVVARRVPDAVAALLALFDGDHAEGEAPADYFRRVDPKRVVAALGDLVASAPAPEEARDVGQDSGFHVAIGAGGVRRVSPLDVARESARLEHARPEERLAFAVEAWQDRLLFTSSFGAGSGVLLHMWSRVAPSLPVVVVDTGFLFQETHAYIELMSRELGLRVERARPAVAREVFLAERGEDIMARDPDACCAHNKVDPLRPYLARALGWVSGLRRDQSPTRAGVPVLLATADGPVKVHPLATVTAAEAEAYARAHAIPDHPLKGRRYLSIGCEPCTRPVAEGGAERAGRWAGQCKTECGLHTMHTRAA